MRRVGSSEYAFCVDHADSPAEEGGEASSADHRDARNKDETRNKLIGVAIFLVIAVVLIGTCVGLDNGIDCESIGDLSPAEVSEAEFEEYLEKCVDDYR